MCQLPHRLAQSFNTGIAPLDRNAPCPHPDSMRRTDRLFDLIQILRDGRLHRAADLAGRVGVSVRTLWRDMATLIASGLPIEGERGVGYILRAPSSLPPLMLAPGELEALRSGLRLVAAGEDAALARAARGLAAKIAAALPMPGGDEEDNLFTYTGTAPDRAPAHVPLLREAIAARERLTLAYVGLNGAQSHRDVRPLALDLQARVWTLTAYCEAKSAFRSFRLDRIVSVAATGEIFADEPGKRLKDFKALGDV